MRQQKVILSVVKTFVLMEVIINFAVPLAFLFVLKGDINDKHLIPMSNISQICIFLIAIVNMRKLIRNNDSEVSKNSWKIVTSQTMVMCILLISNTFLMDGYKLVRIGLTDDFSIMSQNVAVDIRQFVVLLLSYGFLPAVCEEFFYRKMLYAQLRFLGDKYILIGSSVLFCLAHMSFEKLIPMFIFGYILMKIYLDTRSIGRCIFFHMLYNVLELVFTYVFVLPSSTSLIPYKYPSGVECVESGVRYISVALILYMIIYCFGNVIKVKRIKKIL